AQGWGEAGRASGMAAMRDGARVIAVQNRCKVDGAHAVGTLVHPAGAAATPRQPRARLADVDALERSRGDLKDIRGGALLPMLRRGVDASEVRADIVGLNALGSDLNERTVPGYVRSGTHQGKRKILVEGANLAETTEGAALADRNARAL